MNKNYRTPVVEVLNFGDTISTDIVKTSSWNTKDNDWDDPMTFVNDTTV